MQAYIRLLIKPGRTVFIFQRYNHIRFIAESVLGVWPSINKFAPL